VLISDGELVNEAVAQALPFLNHNLLLKMGKLVSPRTYEAGATLARQGAIDEGLFIVTRGSTQVFTERRFRSPALVSTVNPGQYFSELELMETENVNLAFRVSPEGPVEALVLTLDHFNQLLSDYPTAEHALRKAAIDRGCQYTQQPGAKRLFGRSK
jgi:CRP-like cAMP-binding protein